ncbi:MAG: hypothetical protein M1837_005185 [Sclerophora amabilis]|nr:MAG: hypothetical protein M1837_005185 [Sclerophora amabilis]
MSSANLDEVDGSNADGSFTFGEEGITITKEGCDWISKQEIEKGITITKEGCDWISKQEISIDDRTEKLPEEYIKREKGHENAEVTGWMVSKIVRSRLPQTASGSEAQKTPPENSEPSYTYKFPGGPGYSSEGYRLHAGGDYLYQPAPEYQPPDLEEARLRGGMSRLDVDDGSNSASNQSTRDQHKERKRPLTMEKGAGAARDFTPPSGESDEEAAKKGSKK